MSIKKLKKGSDLTIKVDGQILPMIRSFVATKVSDKYEIKQMLCEDVVDNINERTTHKIELEVVSDFDNSLLDNQLYQIVVESDDMIYSYSPCYVLSKQTKIDSHSYIYDKYIIKADSVVSKAVI